MLRFDQNDFAADSDGTKVSSSSSNRIGEDLPDSEPSGMADNTVSSGKESRTALMEVLRTPSFVDSKGVSYPDWNKVSSLSDTQSSVVARLNDAKVDRLKSGRVRGADVLTLRGELYATGPKSSRMSVWGQMLRFFS